MLLGLAIAVAHAGTVRHAVVVGANDGGGVLEPLKYAEVDAQRMGELFVELGEFDDELVTVLYRPTQAALRQALAKHAAIAEEWPDDLFVFYYSGHADAQGLRLGDDRYFYEALKHDLRTIPTEVRIGILDACRSGSITRLKGADVSESILGVQGGAIEGEAWLTASSADELAQESDALRGGFFTHYLLSGMRGAADTDDGVVDLDELNRYTFARVVEITGRTGYGTQHPRFDYQLSGQGSLALTDVRRASAMLTLTQGDAGEIAVFRLPDKIQLAEFSKSPEREMAIAVPPGRYLVRRRHEDATFEATFGVTDGQSWRIEDWGRPTMQFGTFSKGDPRVAALVEASEAYEARMGLGASPVVAGAASLVIPGAGQLYNRQVFKGIGYLAVTSSLLAGVIFDPTEDELGSAFWPMLGAAAWGASIADAVYNVRHNERSRPKMGAQISFGAAFGGRHWKNHAGISADVLLRPSFSIGLDRVGWAPGPDGSWDLSAGSRVMLAGGGETFRPHALVGLGVRYGRAPGPGERFVTRAVFSGGGGFRYYVVPRYFVEIEGRWEDSGEWQGVTSAVGMGVHLGR